MPAASGNLSYHSVNVGNMHFISFGYPRIFPHNYDRTLSAFSLLAVVRCEEDPQAVLMSTHSEPGNSTYGTVIQYECLQGYRFKRGVFVEYVTCTETGNWQPSIRDCEGGMTW